MTTFSLRRYNQISKAGGKKMNFRAFKIYIQDFSHANQVLVVWLVVDFLGETLKTETD